MTDATINFSDLALAPPLIKVLKEIGYESPSPIQAASIPHLLEGVDLIGQAQTGTGKTAAFALPLLSQIDTKLKKPQLLVLAPTRELAIQVSEAFQIYARHMKGFHVLPIYGGQSMGSQLRQLSRGVHVVVGTPGRVMDHLRRGTLKLDNLTSLVLDEADEMLKMGFIDDVEWILEQTPETRQIALFSATMPKEIRRIAQKYLNKPTEIKIKSKTSTVEAIAQVYWQVTGMHKLDALTRILEVEEMDAMIIFVRTKNATVELAERLEARGYSSAAINGDMNQAQREKAIDRLKKNTLDILVATDVAARGLDVPRISHVVNYDIPYDTESYVHRIGRTGRAGRTGKAILFVAPREKRMLASIEKATKQPIKPLQMPTREDIVDKRVEAFKQQITDTIEAEDLAFFEELIESYQSEHNNSIAEIAASLALMAQKSRPLHVKEMKVKQERHSDRGDRGSRGDRPPRRQSAQTAVEAGMVRYKIEVGRDNDVKPGNIVGAIANEAGMDAKHIGHIKIFDKFSTVDLPDDMPKEIFKDLKNAWVCGKKLNIAVDGQDAGDRKPKKSSGKKSKAPKKSKSSGAGKKKKARKNP